MKSLEKIVQRLIINGTLTDQPGLFYGKTGIAVFFFHCARQTGNQLYQDYAMELIEKIQEQIADTASVRYDTGLAGIGVGFEYFLQSGFLVADDNIFDDFDTKMYNTAMYEQYPNLSLVEGLTGWGRYFIYRLQGNGYEKDKSHKALTHIAMEIERKMMKNEVSKNEQPDVYRFLYDLTSLPGYAVKYKNTLLLCRKWKCISEPNVQKLFPYMNQLQRLYVYMKYFKIELIEEINQEWEKWKANENHFLMDMGLLKGWTNEGLLYLSYTYQKEYSWLNLF